jgi:putative flippase GtrA
MLSKLYHHQVVRYLAMASCIVVVELIVFQWIYDWHRNYVLATILSFLLAVVINWFLSRKIVFGASEHHPAKEFLYVALVSIGGLGIQLLVVSLCVNYAHLYPLAGKILSILISFFWNYWFRAHFVFNKRTPSNVEEEIERVDASLY